MQLRAMLRSLGAMVLVATVVGSVPITSAESATGVVVAAVDILGPGVGADAAQAAVRIRPPFPCGEQRVFIVGDSLTFGADYFGKLGSLLTGAGYLPRINAIEGRFTSAGATILRDEALAGRLERVVMVALGTNDAAAGYSTTSFAGNVDKVMAAVGASRIVLWVNLQMKSTTTRPYLDAATVNFNAILTTKSAQYPNLRIADWEATPNRIYLSSDGIHYSSTGYRNRATFTRERLDSLTCRLTG